MEELLQYCMHELAFDGDLGCNIDRLKIFIHNYYESQKPHVQALDDAFYDFVWQYLRQQPSIRIGLAKEVSLEVYIAPQKSKKQKPGSEEELTYTGLELINEAKTLSLTELLQTYGNSLRIAVDPETCFRALTGSHIHQPKLTPMVYTALQLISRSREEGFSVVNLGKKTGYDQKTCFYLVKQLLSMDLIVKLAQGGPGGGNFCIHKSFYIRSPFWQGIRDEANKREGGEENASSSAGQSARLFDEIDSRHLTSPELIKSRIIKLLKMSENGLRHCHNLLVAIGFTKPTKRDRRFFATRIRELIEEKVVEKVLVPRKEKPGFKALCIRLVEDPRNASLDGVVVQDGDIDDEEHDQGGDGPERIELEAPRLHMTIQRQIVRLLEEAGATGLTLNDISIRLGGFDRRTLDLISHRLANPPPPHLADLSIYVFGENSGRERRNRYFTLAGYNAFVRNENIDITGHPTPTTSVDSNLCGGFQIISPVFFHDDKQELAKYADEYRDRTNPPKRGSRKVGRPKKMATTKPPQLADDTSATKTPINTLNRSRKRQRSEDYGIMELATSSSKPPGTKRARSSNTKDISTRRPTGGSAGFSSDLNLTGTANVIGPNSTRPVASFETDMMDTDSPTTQAIDKTSLNSALPITGQTSSETNTLSTSATVINKRSSDLRKIEEPARKRFKSDNSARNAVNLSLLRAENEIMRVVNESGGIANIASKEFFEARSRILTSLEAGGEPISMPIGTQLDRRTLRKILDKLVEKGRLKTLTVTITPRSIQPRLAKLIFTPDTPQEKLDNYIKSLQNSIPTVSTVMHKELENAVDFSGSLSTVDLPSQNMPSKSKAQFLENLNRPPKAGSEVEYLGDEEEIRIRLLDDSRTSSQVFGFILGKVRRARELHQFTLHTLSQPAGSSNIVSTGDRIMALSYYFQEIPVSTYFSIVSALEYNQELYDLMKTPSGRQTPVGDLPSSLYETLKIGKARARSRIFDLMEVLVSLGLVVPLKPTENHTPSITCTSNSHPLSYDTVPITSDKGSPNKMTSYWKFEEVAPIYHYSQINWPPPFYRDMPVRTADESMVYWQDLENACLEKGEVTPTAMESITGPCRCTSSVAHALRKRQSWSSAYKMSWAQDQYLQRKWTDPLTGYTPLSEEDGGRRLLIHICEIVSAPFDTVYNFFLDRHKMFQNEARRICGRKYRQEADVPGGRNLEEKALLAKRIADSKQQLASEWDYLVQQVQPGLPSRKLAALNDLRIKFMQCRGTAASEEWKNRISGALVDSELKDRTTLRTRPKAIRGLKYDLVEFTQGSSVRELVQKLKDTTPSTIQERKKMERGKQASGKQSRSQRFHWTPEYDELARDASAVLRCRCRGWHRMDWTALDKVFPSLPRNNVRQRIVTLRQEPGGESYFRRLEDQWHEIWMEYRQTELLPDPNPDHPFDFDLITHIEFLRKNINKNLLKLGNLDSNLAESQCVISEDITEFLSTWDVTEYPSTVNNVDAIWSSTAEEQRENILLKQVFVIERNSGFSSKSTTHLDVSVAESALKMVLSIPENGYDAGLASTFLEKIGRESVRLATGNLMDRGVITEAIKSDRKTPGRNMRIAELNQEASGGFFRSDFYAQALSMDDVLEEDIGEKQGWDLLSQGGQMAALIDFASRGEIQFDIDISEPIFHRKELDWNSKKVDDDQIETTISVLYRPSYVSESPATPPDSSMMVDVESKNHESDSGFACCLQSNGVINCSRCLEMGFNYIVRELGNEKQIYLEMRQKIDAAGVDGLSGETVFDQLLSSDVQRLRFLHQILSANPPLCYWTGYDQPILVSARHVRPWTVLLPTPPTTYIFPRRWINLHGDKTPLWRSALCAVASVLFLRPGLSLAELRRKLVSVYDRQEVNDVLHFLFTNDFVTKAIPSSHPEYTGYQIREIGSQGEEHVSLFLTSIRRWYDVFKK